MTGQPGRPAKPTVEELGIDVRAQAWKRSGRGAGSVEIAFVGVGTAPGGSPPAPGGAPATGGGSPAPGGAAAPGRDEWVLMRLAGDPAERVLVYDRHEWECFLDGVKNGEFDDAAG